MLRRVLQSIFAHNGCRRFAIRASNQRCQKLPCHEKLAKGARLFGFRLRQLCLCAQFAERRIAAHFDQQLRCAQQLVRCGDIVSRQHCAIFGGPQIGMGKTDITFEIG